MTHTPMLDRRRLVLGTAATLAATSLGSSARAQQKPARSYILSTATTAGTYYAVGVAFGTLVKVKLQGSQNIDMSAIPSAGSGENIKLLRENQAQFAILQGLYGLWAWNGSGDFKNEGKQDWLRSITMVWQNVEQFVVKKELAKTGTVEDIAGLKGQPFSIGARNSGTEGSGREILGNLGIDPESLKLVFQGYGPTAESLQNGTIVGANMTGGPPVPGVTQAMAAVGKDLTILDFTDEQIKKANKNGELWTRFVLKAGTYPNQDKDIQTCGQPNLLACRADVDEEAAYLITKTMYENLPFLNNIHAATKEMSLEGAMAGLPAPLHPGAAKFYKEKGLAIPDRLIAKT